ncbi:hypothetical protein [Methylobacterium sp. CCH5-D2]|uniref:hypothetical protein n=1 Tax=Methylobacterium sp. CCH5-D2 TaxID=1768765 RepID=UPI0009E7CF05|nr:hypothetical protein [Methylobacterium sp. CCH5-D2]
MKWILPVCALALSFSGSAFARSLLHRPAPELPSGIAQVQPNDTGAPGSLIISRGSTGADTIFLNSAAGGNAGQPERAIPLGSGGGGDSGGSP